MKKIGFIVQARMGATRLPGKVMMNLSGKSVLNHVIERIEKSKYSNKIIIATTNLDMDKVIVKEAERMGIEYYQGSEKDVLSRYYNAALKHNIEDIIRITSDNPLIDPRIIDELISIYRKNNFELVSNSNKDNRTFPIGLDAEIFSFKALEGAFNNATEDYEREHVTPYLYENEDNIYIHECKTDYSNFRWTLDKASDYEFIRKVYEELYQGVHDFYLDEIVKLLKEKPKLTKINEEITQKP